MFEANLNISIIAAVSENNVIGINGYLPWSIPSDLQRFKDITMGNTVIMGSKTFKSIGKALKGRRNIIMSSNQNLMIDNAIVVNNVNEVLSLCSKDEKIFVIGGEAVYVAFLPYATRIYLTRIKAFVIGDAFFPEIDMSNWEVFYHEDIDSCIPGEFSYSFNILHRKSNV